MRSIRWIVIFLYPVFLISSCSTKEEPIYLLVRADDMGVTHSVNRACVDVYRNGIVRSVELMVPTPWFMEAVEMLDTLPGYDVGIHLALTSEWTKMKWGPVSHAPSLTDSNGYFFTTYWDTGLIPEDQIFGNNPWTIEDVEKELRAQIDLAIKHVPRITHMGIHMGGSNADPKIGEVLAKLGEEYGLATGLPDDFQRFSGFGESSVQLTPAQKIDTLAARLTRLTPGKYIFVEHPAYNDEEMQNIWHPGYENVGIDRGGVTEAWTSEKVKEIIEERKIQLISYRDVLEGRVP